MSAPAPLLKIKTAKHIAPAIFTEKTPRFHLALHEFLKRPSKYKAICMFRGAGKTTNINKIDLFSKVFYEHERFTQIFSSTEKKAQAFISDLKTMIINAIKKKYNIKKGSVWTKSAIEVIVDDKYICYVEVYSVGQDPRGSTYEFARPTLQVYDDIESNVGQYAIRTKANREKLRDWFYKECIPALDPLHGKVIFIGTILHIDSLLNKILSDKKWDTFVQPIIQNGQSVWKDRFPLTSKEAREKERQILEATGKKVEVESLEDIKIQYEKLGQLKSFYQEYLCVAQSEESKMFKNDYFKYFSHVEYTTKEKYLNFKNALEEKRVLIPEPKNIVLEDGTKIPIENTVRYATKDQGSTGSKTKKGNDDSVIVTCAYDHAGNMYIIDISCGKWTPFDKSVNIMRTFKTFQYTKLGIESGGMQNEYFYTINEFQKQTGIRVPVEEMSHHGVNKNIRIANLEVLFLAGKIFFNRNDPNTIQAEAEFLAFDIDVEGDKDNIIDTIAYQRRFQAFKMHDTDDEDDDEDSTW
jgi:hypothetical protein